MCDEPVFWCQPPKWSARRKKFLRYESWAEGVHRYLGIADVMREAATSMTWTPHASCTPPRRGHDDEDGHACRRRRRARPWTGTVRQLGLLLTTVAFYESTYRRDVHEGTTRGDCDYKTVNKRRVLIEGSCRSHCLGQVKLLRREKSRRGHTSEHIVGLSRAATQRCILTVADHLSSARNTCMAHRKPHKGHYAGCIMGVYGGVSNWSKDARIKKRNKTYVELLRTKPKLSKKVRKLLSL